MRIAFTALVSVFAFVAVAASATGVEKPDVADLAVPALSNLPGSIERGAVYRSTFTVSNSGRRAARRSTLQMYLSRDARRGEGDLLLTPPLSIRSLGRDGAIRRTRIVEIPEEASTGRWFLIACADDKQVVTEANEGNNCRTSGARTAVRATRTPTLQQVDGGPDYYRRFSNPLPSSSSYFPVAVWFESVVDPSDVPMDRAVGLNTYVVLTGDSNLSWVRSSGMKAFLQQGDWRTSEAPGSETAGWELHDEIDMQMSADAGYAELQRILSVLPADGRLRYNNFGKGVMFWLTNAEAARYVNAVDLPSNDIYWFTDPEVCGFSQGGALFAQGRRSLTDAECRRASNYGAVVQRMRSLVSPAGSKPVWAFVEVSHPFTGDAPTITGPEIRAAVWHSLIAGARGILYFNHNFGGPCITQHVLSDCGEAVRSAVRSVNSQIKALAPVLNGPTVTSGWRQGSTTKATVKWQGGRFYVFAGSAENAASTGSFAIPCVGDATASVLGERRTIPVNAGAFTDTFADGNAVHIYRIDGGSSCGLS